MLKTIFIEYGDLIQGAIEVILLIYIVVDIIFNGPISTLILNISNGLC
jgi:hypothetical protein